MTQYYLTTTERFKDNTGTLRYEYVSWPVYMSADDKWIVKDIDGKWFEIPKTMAIESDQPSKLVNLDSAQYVVNQKDDGITDYDAMYKQVYGADQLLNTKAQHNGGILDRELKKKLLNGTDFGQKKDTGLNTRNLLIQSEDV